MNTMVKLTISEWLIELSHRCHHRTAENVETIARDYANGLVNLPAAIWNAEAREAASRHFEFFPSYKALRKFMETWVEQHRPVLALPGADDPSLTEYDRHMVAVWRKRRTAGEFSTNEKMALSLSTWRVHSPAMIRYIIRTDEEAKRVAHIRGWDEI
jgi:hypothetical protein